MVADKVPSQKVEGASQRAGIEEMMEGMAGHVASVVRPVLLMEEGEVIGVDQRLDWTDV